MRGCCCADNQPCTCMPEWRTCASVMLCSHSICHISCRLPQPLAPAACDEALGVHQPDILACLQHSGARLICDSSSQQLSYAGSSSTLACSSTHMGTSCYNML
jgi:hypothetical protein